MHFTRRFSSRFVLVLMAVTLTAAGGCAAPQQGPALPHTRIGVADFSQPETIMDMLAGYMPDDTPRVSSQKITELSEAFTDVLHRETSRQYVSGARYLECRDAKAPGQTASRVPAMKRWGAVGQCMDVDFLIVPQVMELHERQGSEAGVTRPAGIVMNFYILNVREGVLVSRSHFDETQMPLTSNLLDAGKFIARGGKWITALELAREGMTKAVKDMGL